MHATTATTNNYCGPSVISMTHNLVNFSTPQSSNINLKGSQLTQTSLNPSPISPTNSKRQPNNGVRTSATSPGPRMNGHERVRSPNSNTSSHLHKQSTQAATNNSNNVTSTTSSSLSRNSVSKNRFSSTSSIYSMISNVNVTSGTKRASITDKGTASGNAIATLKAHHISASYSNQSTPSINLKVQKSLQIDFKDISTLTTSKNQGTAAMNLSTQHNQQQTSARGDIGAPVKTTQFPNSINSLTNNKLVCSQQSYLTTST